MRFVPRRILRPFPVYPIQAGQNQRRYQERSASHAGCAPAGAAAWSVRGVFHAPYHFDPLTALGGIAIGEILDRVAGTLGTRRVLTQPPAASLRESM